MCKKSTQIIDSHPYFVRIRSGNGWVEAGVQRKTLVAALIGMNNSGDYGLQVRKIEAMQSMSAGPEIITDLSTIRLYNQIPLWTRIIKETSFVAATLPVYMAGFRNGGIDREELLDITIEQMEKGVGLITIHPTPSKELFELSQSRIVPCTSRGGGIILRDMILKDWKKENAYVKILPEIVSAAKKNGTVLSIGTTFRSANIFDAYDEVQRRELKLQLHIARDITREGVGVVIEAPGHAQPKDIKKIATVLRSGGFPVMPLGPIPTDIAIGMDHIASAIGATLLGIERCAHILAAVTRDEHTGGIPTIEATIESVKAARIAAHIIDIHVLRDDGSDLEVVKLRAVNHTCVAGKRSIGCERCGYLCPLWKLKDIDNAGGSFI